METQNEKDQDLFEHISLDGVIEHGEDYEQGEWTAPYRSPAGMAAVIEAHGTGFDLLLGRRTYDIWAGFWPKAGNSPMADGLNAATKYVATHSPDSLGWGPVKDLGADIIEGVRGIKSKDGPDLIVWGSSTLSAGICGVLYLYIIVAGIFAELFVRGRLVVSADAAATASNIMAHETLFRLGFSGELLHLAFDVAVAVILYALLRPVDRNIALLAAFMRFACDIILAVASLSHFAALRLFADADYLKTFRADQLNTLALLALKLHDDSYAISLVFFSFACLSLGYLIFRSGFLPRTIGALMAIAGVCYLVNSFSHFLAPVFAATLFPALFVPIFVAELSLTLWLIVRGVNVVKWEERATGAAS